jgi:hypothetical protein
MLGKTVRIFTVSVLLMAGGMHASAETATPSESVTVTANKSREVFGKFVKGFAKPTMLTGKIARWERRLCPLVVGQNPNFTTFITQRIKYIALAAGAYVNTEASCTPNIEIIFTTTPQALLDNIQKDDPDYLGYATSNAQREALATITRPIQAWYTTETVDLSGRSLMDSGRPLGGGIGMSNFNALSSDGGAANRDPIFMADAHYARATGSRINDGIRTGFNHILIIIDSTKLAGQKIVPLADYISMLALTQLNSLDACQQQPSIVNILAADCDHAGDGLTQFDLAYLQGLYRMSAGRSLLFQRNDIAAVMADKVSPDLVAAARQNP